MNNKVNFVLFGDKGHFMFHKGTLESYDSVKQMGVIHLLDKDIQLDFSSKDFPNLTVQPQLGERVKCLIEETDNKYIAKFIVRLEHNNASQQQPLNHVFYTEDDDHSRVKKARFKINCKESKNKNLAVDDRWLNQAHKICENAVFEKSNTPHESSGFNAAGPATEEKYQSDKQSNQREDSPQRSTSTQQQDLLHTRSENNNLAHKSMHDLEFLQQNESKLQKLKTYWSYKRLKQKTQQTAKPVLNKNNQSHLDPWACMLAFSLLLCIAFAYLAFQQYQQHKQEREAKARYYLSEQQKAIKEQRRKMGKLSDTPIIPEKARRELFGERLD